MRVLIAFNLILCLLFQRVNAQRFDNTWYLGYPGNGEIYGPSKVTFNTGSFSIKKDTAFFGGIYDSNNTVISDFDGTYFAAFNGFWINDASGKKMLNGDSIWYETLPYLFGYSDDDLTQGGMFLPWPGHPDSILLFYTSQGNSKWPASLDLACLNLFYAVIQKSGNNGTGVVVERRKEIINDTIQYGRLSAVQHANGRDWWILINERYSNRFYRLLLDPNGVQKLDSQIVSLSIIDGVSQSAFSPDGNFYAIKNSVGGSIGNSIDIFHFDRCSGYLSNQYQIHKDGSSLGGLAFSPNSRFLYVSYRTEIYQYDLYSNNLDASKILVGIYEPPPSGPASTFFTMQLAPDNKIYLCATNAIMSLHVINSPDEYGLDCQFQQRGVMLTTKNYSSVSYSPYYRLGPLDGSTCDTLGLDKLPVSWWRSEEDTLDPFQVYFHDLSWYEPTEWHWVFGDPGSGLNNTSEERHPQHLFSGAGAYTVCLGVCNANACDTFCRELKLGNSPSKYPYVLEQIQVSPNPFSYMLCITNTSPFLGEHCIFRLYNQMSTLVCERKLSFGMTLLHGSESLRRVIL